MLRTYPTMAALAAMAYAAADKGGSGAPDPVVKADPAPHPQSADETAPAAPQPDPQPAAEGIAADADPNPPTNAADAAAASGEKSGKAGKPAKMLDMVWVQPGHEVMSIGMLFRTPGFEGEGLRGAGRARYASEAEIKAAKEAKHDIPELTGL